MLQRMTRAVQGNVELYEEVEHNESLTTEAYTIVGIVAAITFAGGLLLSAISAEYGLIDAVWSGVNVVLFYFIWSFLTYWLGTKVFNGKATWGEMQRTLGYAMTPQIFSFVPCLGFIASLWSLYLGFVAVRQGLDIDNTRTLLTIVGSFFVAIGVGLLISLVAGVGTAGLNLITP